MQPRRAERERLYDISADRGVKSPRWPAEPAERLLWGLSGAWGALLLRWAASTRSVAPIFLRANLARPKGLFASSVRLASWADIEGVGSRWREGPRRGPDAVGTEMVLPAGGGLPQQDGLRATAKPPATTPHVPSPTERCPAWMPGSACRMQIPYWEGSSFVRLRRPLSFLCGCRSVSLAGRQQQASSYAVPPRSFAPRLWAGADGAAAAPQRITLGNGNMAHGGGRSGAGGAGAATFE